MNVGITWGLTVIFIVDVVAHWPAAGVKMYERVPAVAVLTIAGFQVPVTPLLDVVGKTGAVEFWQSAAICENVGITWDVTTTSIVVVVPHCPAPGVKV